MSAPVIIDYLMDAILRQRSIQDNKQAVEQNGSEIRERMDEKLEASGKRRDFEVSSDKVTDENLKMKNLSDGKTSRKRKKRTKRVEEKDTAVDESQSFVPLIMEEGSKNIAEGNATEKRNKKRKRKKAKVSDEVQILVQNNTDTGSTAKKIETIEKSILKDDVRSMGLTRMDERSGENLAEGIVNIEKPKSKDEGQTADQTKMGAGSTEKNSDNGTGKRKKKHKRKAKIKDEVQGEVDTISGEMNVRSIEILFGGDVTFEKPKVKDDVKTIGQFKNESGSAENSVEGDVKVEKPRIKDEVQNLDQITMVSGSTAEGSVTIRVARTQDEVQSMDQTNMDRRPSENVDDGQGTIKKKKKRKNKAKMKDGVQREMDTRSTEALAEENATVEKPKRGDEILGVGQSKLDTGSSENLTVGNLTIKDKKEVENMDQTKFDTGGLTENSTEGNETGKRKKKRRSKVQINDEVQSNIYTRSTENPAQGNVTMEKPKIKDEVQSVGQSKMGTGSVGNLAIKDLHEVQSMAQIKMDTEPTENSAEGNVTGKRKKKRKSKIKNNNEVPNNIDTRSTKDLPQGNEIIEMPKTKDDVQRIGQTKTASGSTENSALGGIVTIKNPNIQDEVQDINHSKMDTGPTENSAGAVTGERKKKWKSKVKIDEDVQWQRDTSLTENLALGNLTNEMLQIKDEVHSIDQTKMDAGSTRSTGERNVSIRTLKIQDEAQSMDQIKMDMGPSENFADANLIGEGKRNRKSKAKIKDVIQSEQDTQLKEYLGQGNVIIEKPKIKDDVRTPMTPGSILAERNVSVANLKIQDEAQRMDQIKMDTGTSESFAEGNVTGKIKKKQKSKAKINGELHRELDTRLSENLAEGNVFIEKPKIKDDVMAVSHSKTYPGSIEILAKRNLSIKNPEIQDEAQTMDQIKMDKGPSENFAERNVTGKTKRKLKSKPDVKHEAQCDNHTAPTENLTEGNMTTEKRKIEDEVQSGGRTTLDTGSSVYPAEGNVTIKNSKIQDEAHSMNQTQMDMGPTEYSAEGNVTAKRKKQRKKKATTEDEIPSEMDTRSTENLAERNASVKKPEMEAEVQSVGFVKMDTGSTEMFAIGNASIKKPEIDNEFQSVGLAEMDTGSKENLAEGRKRKRKIRRKKVKSKDEIILDKGKDYANGLSAVSTCDVRETAKDVCPQTAPRRKLLVLDVNGLLADIIFQGARESSGGVRMYGRTVYKRPFCDDFLKFCFQNFDVGIWSSRSKKIIDKVVSYLLGDQRDKLLFCWDMDHSTQTGLKTLENKHKPLVCKELRKIWENAYPNLPWKKGDYDESNTLLLDDSPYKALLNPLHTAIFPDPYQYNNEKDDSLGPGGALRVYLEGLLTSEDVQKYVEQHPIGQRPITEENSYWEFYSSVLRKKTSVPNPLKDETLMPNPPLTDETPMPNPPMTDETPMPNPPSTDETPIPNPPSTDETPMPNPPLTDETPMSNPPLKDTTPIPIHALS